MRQSSGWMRMAAILALGSGFAVGARADDPAATPAAAPVVAEAPVAATAAPAAAAEAPTGPKISGFVQSSYSYDLNDPLSGMTNYRVYDSHNNTFLVNNAHVAITGGLGKVGYTIETDLGHDAVMHRSTGFAQTLNVPTVTQDPLSATTLTAGTQAFTVDPDADIFDLQEAYVTFPDPFLALAGIDATVKVGKWATYEGIEVIESGANPTISRGLLYGQAEAYTHVGVAVSVPAGPVTVTAGILNGWDRILDDNKGKMGVVNVAASLGDKIGTVNLTGYSGSEQANTGLKKNSVDLTSLIKLIPSVDLWWQVNYGDEQNAYDPVAMTGGGVNKWGGATIQPVVHLNDKLSLGLRGEYFETKGYAMPGTMLSNGTITLAWAHAAGIVTRFEFRHDESNNVGGHKDALGNDTGGPAGKYEDWNGNAKRGTSTLSIETIVSF